MENIVASGRRRRFLNGLIFAAVACATVVWLVRTEAAAPWYVLVFLMILLAALMLLQARDKT